MEMTMISMMSLWLPILLASVLAFLISAIIHQVLRTHRNDYARMPNEDDITDAIRKAGVGPGDYVFPCPENPADFSKPEAQEKVARGPFGFITIYPPGPLNMGKNLGLWFFYLLVVNLFVAYVVSRTVAPDGHYLQVFRVAGTAAFLCFAGAYPANSIWKGHKWSASLLHMFDGLIYALMTAGCFGWLWPR
jgi:hypothetical protein